MKVPAARRSTPRDQSSQSLLLILSTVKRMCRYGRPTPSSRADWLGISLGTGGRDRQRPCWSHPACHVEPSGARSPRARAAGSGHHRPKSPRFTPPDRRASVGSASPPQCPIFRDSTRRESEISRLEWADNGGATRTGLARDAKHPRDKDGISVQTLCELTANTARRSRSAARTWRSQPGLSPSIRFGRSPRTSLFSLQFYGFTLRSSSFAGTPTPTGIRNAKQTCPFSQVTLMHPPCARAMALAM
jgi:hypothetical protein